MIILISILSISMLLLLFECSALNEIIKEGYEEDAKWQ